ncbi:MAG: DUF411 domain-containing protein [Alphaproteobacteria bacterium]|jgi:hypothetical protein|nr:DUF411 domain-containing protein [Alphaproteobacteria bacterium]MBU1548767.1 DUF411 domain-containing protein [Alphaproteobacteria bacterium]MBU2335593.1 DUF411 domain-containing protein [Alphaproteobacteria bacterium]MBU2391012.1 DUF411 domain-containing protein [Alphaproteobacteria bacterium]
MKRRQFICTAVASIALVGSTPTFATAAEMTVYKDPYCGCCGAWADAMRAAGYAVLIENVADMAEIKARYNIPSEAEGCHTAVIGNYVFEGHVPLEAVQQVLREKPAIAGLAVAGMPTGSLGMGDDPGASYDVMALNTDGSQDVYLRVRP